jgi:hypothetical protein
MKTKLSEKVTLEVLALSLEERAVLSALCGLIMGGVR